MNFFVCPFNRSVHWFVLVSVFLASGAVLIWFLYFIYVFWLKWLLFLYDAIGWCTGEVEGDETWHVISWIERSSWHAWGRPSSLAYKYAGNNITCFLISGAIFILFCSLPFDHIYVFLEIWASTIIPSSEDSWTECSYPPWS